MEPLGNVDAKYYDQLACFSSSSPSSVMNCLCYEWKQRKLPYVSQITYDYTISVLTISLILTIGIVNYPFLTNLTNILASYRALVPGVIVAARSSMLTISFLKTMLDAKPIFRKNCNTQITLIILNVRIYIYQRVDYQK
jgi:hypothetical protein